MAGPADEHERTIAFAEIALGQIKALRQAASPRVYELWYNYATGYNPKLNQKVNETLSASGTLTDSDIDQIYSAFISPTRMVDEIGSVNAKMGEEIEQVMALIDTAAPPAPRHDASPSDVTPQPRRANHPRPGRGLREKLGQTAAAHKRDQ